MRAASISILLLAACAEPVVRDSGVDSRSTFWRWFVAHQDDVATIRTASEPIADALHAELHKVDPQLTFELGTTLKPREFVISADGSKKAFPAVQGLVAAAPEIAGWKVMAFRQRHPGHDRVDLDGFSLKVDDVAFRSGPAGEKALNLELYLKVDAPKARQAAYLLLDSVLGEYDVETRVAGIHVTSEAPPPDARPLRELAQRIDALK